MAIDPALRRIGAGRPAEPDLAESTDAADDFVDAGRMLDLWHGKKRRARRAKRP